MNKITIQPRPLSPGEISDAQRNSRYWQKRQAALVPGKKPNKNTIAIRPPRFQYQNTDWSPENEV